MDWTGLWQLVADMSDCSLPADKRTIHLSDIAERTKLNVDGVEFLLMKTLSLNLIKGTIDEVDQTVHVSFPAVVNCSA